MSGIYIRGMEMPKDGYRTITVRSDGLVLLIASKESGKDKRTEAGTICVIGNAIPVPDHGRLISAELLKADFTGNFVEAYPTGLVWAMIDDAPTIIPAEKEAEE